VYAGACLISILFLAWAGREANTLDICFSAICCNGYSDHTHTFKDKVLKKVDEPELCGSV